MLSICMHVWFIYPLNGNWLSVNGDLLLFAKEIIACSKISDKSYLELASALLKISNMK